jgi:hypothetical protein
MIELVKEYGLWSSFLLCCFIVGTYHFQIILSRYSTKSELQNDFYKKTEVDRKIQNLHQKQERILNEIDKKLERHVTILELENLEKLMNLRFTQQDKILNKMQEDLKSLGKVLHKL